MSKQSPQSSHLEKKSVYSDKEAEYPVKQENPQTAESNVLPAHFEERAAEFEAPTTESNARPAESEALHGAFDQGTVHENIMSLARPMLLAQLVGVLYNLVDRMFIGHLPEVSAYALTGIGVVFPLITMSNAFANWSGQGGATLFSIARGEGDQRRAQLIQGNACFLQLLFSLGLMVTLSIFEAPLLNFCGVSSQTYEFAADYLRIYLLGTPFQLISLGMNPFISAQGFGRTAMFSVMIGALSNLILDPLFIFGFGLGIRGAALATVLSQLASGLWTLSFLMGKRALLKLENWGIRPHATHCREILQIGFANFVFQATTSTTQAVSNSVLLSAGGDLHVAIMTVIASLRQIFSLPTQAMTNAAKPVLSFNYGAKKYPRVIECIFWMLRRTGFINLTAGLLLCLFPAPFMRLFTASPVIIAEGVLPMRLYFCCFFFMSLQTSGQSTFTALGLAKEATFFSLLRKIILLLPLTIFLPRFPFLGVQGVYFAESLSQLIGGTACFATMWWRAGKRLQQGIDLRS